MSTRNIRIEKDSMGEMEVPADALYGASTMRAVLNFPISDLRFPRTFIRALGLIKLAAAKTNMVLGALDEKIGNAIVEASQEVADGKLDQHFVLDIFQTGSGTSTNTNANEVIANRASQVLGGDLGSRIVHPNDHVNLGQSSNDVIPTAMHLAALMAIKEDLLQALETDNHFQAQSSLDAIVEASGELRTIAISLHKIANDIRFLACGPRAGIGEIALPEVQPGSSIMPGKINPVIAESVIQVAAHVVGNDATVTLAGQGSYFELNTMMPVAAYNILQSISLLATSAHNFAEQCVKGIQATEVGPQMVERGLMLGTALSPAIGYDAAAAIAKEAAATGKTIREVAKLRTNLSDEQLDQLLNPEEMTRPS